MLVHCLLRPLEELSLDKLYSYGGAYMHLSSWYEKSMGSENQLVLHDDTDIAFFGSLYGSVYLSD